MAKFIVKAKYYATYEYDNVIEIDAASAEDAAAEFEKMAGKRGSGALDYSDPIDDNFNISGHFDVFLIPAGANEDNVISQGSPAIEQKEFKGPA